MADSCKDSEIRILIIEEKHWSGIDGQAFRENLKGKILQYYYELKINDFHLSRKKEWRRRTAMDCRTEIYIINDNLPSTLIMADIIFTFHSLSLFFLIVLDFKILKLILI